ncbi:hypothetical protein ACQR0V_23985 [Bradyrhizobium sp. HKCCYLS2058]|uniref:hypothetical protein n=1 Tax=unclassified Bradyrhizobium TaxID=2631580 RepID=UPI003EC04709
MRRWPLVSLIPPLLTGCVTQSAENDKAAEAAAMATHLPADYRQILANDFKTWPDYAGMPITKAQISNPAKEFGDILNGGTVVGICVRYMTKPRAFGQELSPRTVVESISFTNKRLNHAGLKGRREIAMLSCDAKRVYSPFPEIETE